MAKFVLIETSWNVKKTRVKDDDDDFFCINRNIVECKDCWIPKVDAYLFVLIETSWNVKFGTKRIGFHATFVLIETSWNVKEHH